jgi:hypothetical protein
MQKPWLLLAGYNYYPEAKTGDWIKRFATYEEANDFVTEVSNGREFKHFHIENTEYDWYQIVDLNTYLLD